MIMTPLYESEGELYSLFDQLMRYDEDLDNDGEVSVYAFMRMCKTRTPIGLSEYRYNVILNTCTVSHRIAEDKEYWWAKFYILQRRSTWDVTPHQIKNGIYEV